MRAFELVLREVRERNPGQQFPQKVCGFLHEKYAQKKIKIMSHAGKNREVWGCSSVVGHVPSVWVALVSILSTGGKM